LDALQSSVREVVRRVQGGDTIAEQRLWNEFYEKLLRYVEVRVRRRGVPTGLIDEEAVTVSVLESVFKCAKQGRLQNVQDWSELFRLLLAMTNRKFVDHWRRATARRVLPPTRILPLSQNTFDLAEHDLEGCSVAFDEQISLLLALLPDDLFRQIAVLKLAGYTLAEISEEVQRAVPTVNRKWQYIRRMWADELDR
jgi:DNA-directed RNA polymerase specialized sigma24 family protein